MMKRVFIGGLLVFLSSSFEAKAQCSFWTEIPVDLGNDTVLCSGQSLVLDASNGFNYDYYLWSTGGTTPTLNVNAAGTYAVQTGMVGNNIVVNGDFESGNTGFTSGYVQGTGGTWGTLSFEGTYDISTSPSLSHSNFTPCGDHTSGSGNMMVVNGAGTPVSVWCQTINVIPNTDYLFSSWATNALNDLNVAQLQFSINGATLGNMFSVTPTGCDWVQFNATWNSGSNTTADICIINQNTAISGNDFAIDDITFQEVCTVTDTINVAVETITVEAGPNLTFCPNEAEDVTATSNLSPVDFLWNTGSPNATISPQTTGWYYVDVTSNNGCTATDSVYIDVIPMDWTIDSILMGPTACGSNNGYVSAMTSGTFNDPPIYTWNGPGAGNPNQINASVFQNLSPGWYYLSIESAGCYQYDSMEVTVSNPPLANFTANPTTGEAPLAVTFTNGSQNANTYVWDFGNGQGANSNTTSTQNTVYDMPGLYNVMLVANQGGCSDTAYTTILVVAPEVFFPGTIQVPNVFTPDNDEINDVFEVQIANMIRFEIQIVNRWGNLVFESDDPQFKWDGTISGNPATEGTYFYRYSAVDLQEETFEGHGFVELRRKH